MMINVSVMNLIAALLIGSGSSASVPVIRLADLEQRLRNGGDTTYVVNFWATWCKPCIAELPAFDKLARSVKGQAVRVILVSLDDPRELTSKVEPFVRKKGLLPDVVLMDEAKPHEWIDKIDPEWSGAIPATLLVQTSTGKRAFFEQEFSYEQLNTTIANFISSAP